MENTPIRRRLTAILAADAVGYSARMGENEERTLRTLAGHRQVMSGLIAAHDGRLVGTSGDGMLAEFGSSVEAVRCAVEIQEALATRNDLLPEAERLQFRIGVNLGDVIVEGADILGDGVNVAARLESIAEPGGICVASSVFDQISGKLNLGFEDIGEQSLKNIARPVRAYRFAGTSGAPSAPRARPRKSRGPLIAAAAVVVLGAVAAGVYTLTRTGQKPAETAAQSPAPASEETRIKLQIAEAERATAEAELARVRAETEKAQSLATASAATPPRVTMATPPAGAASAARADEKRVEPTPAPAAPAAPARGARAGFPPPGAALSYQGGMALMRCPAEGDEPAVAISGPVRVNDGEIIITSGAAGRAGSFILRGRPGPAGGLIMRGNLVGRGRGRANAQYQGKLVNGRGLLTGGTDRRICTLSLDLK
jgi:class 3 adenylate cyclase